MNRRKLSLSIAATILSLIVVVSIALAWYVWPVFNNMNSGDTPISVYVDEDDTMDSIRIKVGSPKRWEVLQWYFQTKPRTGHYLIQPGEKMLDVYRKFRNGTQSPVRVTVPQVRTLDMLAARLAKQLMLDSATISSAFRDTSFCNQVEYNWQTLPALFIPNTYEMWWNTSIDKFMQRMQRENKAFWTEARMEKALNVLDMACKIVHENNATYMSPAGEEIKGVTAVDISKRCYDLMAAEMGPDMIAEE